LICPGCALDELKGGGERGPGCPMGDGPVDKTACCWGFTCAANSCTSVEIYTLYKCLGVTCRSPKEWQHLEAALCHVPENVSLDIHHNRMSELTQRTDVYKWITG
jgi:hypothetical protein